MARSAYERGHIWNFHTSAEVIVYKEILSVNLLISGKVDLRRSARFTVFLQLFAVIYGLHFPIVRYLCLPFICFQARIKARASSPFVWTTEWVSSKKTGSPVLSLLLSLEEKLFLPTPLF